MTTRYYAKWWETPDDGWGNDIERNDAITTYATIEEAQKRAEVEANKEVIGARDWEVIARTIDEATFTIKDEVVKRYKWFEEVGKYEFARQDIAREQKEIMELRAKKARCRTEKGIKKVEAEIEQTQRWLNRHYEILHEPPKY